MPGLLSAAFAGSIYINGVKADGITNFELDDVDVVIDGKGDVYIDAPRYAIEVISPGGSQPQPETPVVVDDSTLTTAPAVPTGGLAPETWWLVSEDNGSLGHSVDVSVGGRLVATVNSGDPQLILDISAYLSPGDNVVSFTAKPGPEPQGGVFTLYVGPGTNVGGALQLEAPQVEYSRRSTSGGTGESSQHTLTIP